MSKLKRYKPPVYYNGPAGVFYSKVKDKITLVEDCGRDLFRGCLTYSVWTSDDEVYRNISIIKDRTAIYLGEL